MVSATGGTHSDRLARLRDPADISALRERIDTLRCQRSLAHFMRRAWPVIDTAHYQHNWHIDVIAEHLEAVMLGQIPRLLLNEPPRHMKSSLASIAFPAFVWIQDEVLGEDGVRLPTCGPHCQFFYASYDQDLSTDHAVKTRDLIASPWYQARWGHKFQFKGDVNLKTKYENTVGGKRMASSVGGRSAGFGGDIIVVDDPHNTKTSESDKIRDETVRWFFEVLQTRLNDPKRGAFVVVMQRVHERDIAGEILAREMGLVAAPTTAKRYVHVCLPARFEVDHPFRWRGTPGIGIGKPWEHGDFRTEDGELLWPERFGDAELDTLTGDLGEYAVAGQLQQRPAPRSGGFFNTKKIEILDHLPVDEKGNTVKITARWRAWDLAATKDIGKADPSWTCGVLMARDEAGFFYVEHVTRFRENPTQMEANVVRQAEIDGRDVRILLPKDPGQSGVYQVQYLTRALAGYIVDQEPQSGDKGTRATPFASQVGAGNVKLIRGPWNRAFIDELASFPMGRHNDQVDAASSAFNRIAAPAKRAMILGGGVR